jgi:glutamate racemase
MNKKPIGIFDSGVGGLTVAREIMRLLPDESIIYLGDTANLPYGEKSAEIITGYSVANTEFLLEFGIKVLVVACNTASSVALDFLKRSYDIPIIGVIEPAVKGAIYSTRNRKIGVIGTNRTIKSDVYARVICSMDSGMEVFSRACPLFVPLIEDNFIEHEATKLIASEYLREFIENGIDSLILGCTHYPLISEIIAGILPSVKLIDSASSTARDLQSVLETNRMLNESGRKPEKHRFFATDITDKLDTLAKRILGFDMSFGEVCLKSRQAKN